LTKKYFQLFFLLFLAGIFQGGICLEWQKGANLPYPVMNASAVVCNNHVYIFGGTSGGFENHHLTKKILSAPINPDGSFGTFTEQRATLPEPRAGLGLGVYENTIFVFGGYNQKNFKDEATCWTFKVNPNGQLNPAQESRTVLPKEGKGQIGDGFNRSDLCFNGRLYIIGGSCQEDANNYPNLIRAYVNTIQNRDFGPVWQASIQTNPVVNPANQHPGVWNTGVCFVKGRNSSFAFQLGGCLHPNTGTFGKENTTNQVAVAAINPVTGLFDSWRKTNPLPTKKQCGLVLSVGNTIFVIGGTGEEQNIDNRVYIGEVSPDTGDVSWRVDGNSFPYSARCPCGVSYTSSDGTPIIAVMGGYESSYPYTNYARIYPDKMITSVPLTAPVVKKPEDIFTSPKAIATPSPSQKRYVNIPVPGFHPFERAAELIKGPPPQAHVIYFNSKHGRLCANQNLLLQDPLFYGLPSRAVFVWINTSLSPNIAYQLNVFKVPTWIFYDSGGVERYRTTGILTPAQIAEKISQLK